VDISFGLVYFPKIIDHIIGLLEGSSIDRIIEFKDEKNENTLKWYNLNK